MDIVIGVCLYLLVGLLVNIVYENKINLGILAFWPLYLMYRIYIDISSLFD